MRFRSTRRRLSVECLEGRLTPAGNITAAVIDGLLVIEGDAEANGFTVTQFTESIFPSGTLAVEGDATTLVNGEGDVELSGVTRGVDINTGPGADDVTVEGVHDLSLRVRTGPGNDSLLVESVQAEGALIVRTQGGDDRVELFNVDLGAIDIRTGRGADTVWIDETQALGLVLIRTGKGNDSVEIERNFPEFAFEGSTFEGPVEIRMGRQDDTIRVGIEGNPKRSAEFQGAVTFHGGGGTDGLDAGLDSGTNNGNTFAVAPVVTAIENLLS